MLREENQQSFSGILLNSLLLAQASIGTKNKGSLLADLKSRVYYQGIEARTLADSIKLVPDSELFVVKGGNGLDLNYDQN